MIEQVFDWTWAWIIAGAVIAGLEILVPGMFLLWIGIGAVATGVLLARYPDLTLAWQFLVFAVSMVSSIGIGFWIQRRSGRSKQARFLNREMKAMVGKRYVAITPFTVGRGRIKVHDSSYAALSNEDIAAGDVVEVVAIEDGRPKVVKAPGSAGTPGPAGTPGSARTSG
jgi:inner membrane protein